MSEEATAPLLCCTIGVKGTGEHGGPCIGFKGMTIEVKAVPLLCCTMGVKGTGEHGGPCRQRGA